MASKARKKVVGAVLAAAVVAAVLGGSALSSSLWGGKPETVELPDDAEATPALKARVALEQEAASKNWHKIRFKFAAWGAFLAVTFVLVRKRRVTPRVRLALYGASVLAFGVILGSDPSPMGTVKDAVVLFGRSGAIFPPRLVALGVFLLLTVVANKFICSWGCQLGTLQDLLFRLNRDTKDAHRLFLPQVKIPFALTNAVRIAFFAALVGAALLWATDIVAPIDPFRVFKPTTLALGGAAFLAVVLCASLVVYRPWCHLLCPFGLLGWLAEKTALFKIRVDRDICIDCKRCAKACPSTVMAAILEADKVVIPDCFSCATCSNVCPTGAIEFDARRRRG